MKTKKVKLALGGCVLALTMATAVACSPSVQAEAYSANLSSELSYSFGESFVIPDATISYEGEDVPATRVVLIYPNGVMVEGNTHFLQDEGTYEIVYYATVSGKVISAEKTFEVVKSEDYVNVKPTITLDPRFSKRDGYKIAINETVVVPEATATDDNLVGGVKTTIYYNYGTDKQQVIDMKNGTFTPTKVGEHAIVYSAVDAYGERAEEVVYVSCAFAEDVGNVALKISAEDVTRNAGEEGEISPCALAGLYDDLSNVRVFAIFEGETEREEIFNYRYFPRNVGDYQIVYEYETPFKTYSATSVLTTEAVGNVELNENALPNYFIKGASYTIDGWVGYVFDEKYPTKTEAKTYMKSDDGVYEEINRKDFKIDASSTVCFKFEIGAKTIETEKMKVVDVGFGGELTLNEYFQGDGFTKAENEAIYVVEEGEGDYTLEFINVTSLSSFNLEFTVPQNDSETNSVYDQLQAIDVTLTDYYDREKSVTARYENVNGFLTLWLNGGAKKDTGKAFAGRKNNFFFNDGAFCDSSGWSCQWENVFESDKVLLSVTLVGVYGDAGLKVQRLGEQGFNAVKDSIEPNVYYPNPQGGIHVLGSIVELSASQVTDVLSPYLEKNHKFYVTGPDGNYVTSVDGVVLDGTCDVTRSYRIKIDSVGSYFVRYVYEDQSGNSKPSYYTINVPDRTPPVIQLTSASDGDLVKAKVNSWVKFSEYSVSDDTSSVEEMIHYVVIYDPDYIRATVEDGKFAALKKGDYLVCYYAYDAEGNYDTASYTVRVE